jgi:GTP-binding protein
MRAGGASTAPRHRAGSDQEGSLTAVTFVGSFPTPDFRLDPTLPEVAFVGRSNVGKSSLINALVGRKALARISKTPGKTRDCNVYTVGGSFYLVDLPGYGYAKASQDPRRRFARLVHEYVSDRKPLIGVVWLLDVRRDMSPDDRNLGERLVSRGVPTLLAVTKGDKLPRGQRLERVQAILHQTGMSADQAVITSAKSREGINELRDAVLSFAGGA